MIKTDFSLQSIYLRQNQVDKEYRDAIDAHEHTTDVPIYITTITKRTFLPYRSVKMNQKAHSDGIINNIAHSDTDFKYIS